MDVSANARRGQRQQPSPAWRGTQVDRRRCWAESAPGGSAPREARAGKGGGWRHSKSCKGRRACRWGGKAEASRRGERGAGKEGGEREAFRPRNRGSAGGGAGGGSSETQRMAARVGLGWWVGPRRKVGRRNGLPAKAALGGEAAGEWRPADPVAARKHAGAGARGGAPGHQRRPPGGEGQARRSDPTSC